MDSRSGDSSESIVLELSKGSTDKGPAAKQPHSRIDQATLNNITAVAVTSFVAPGDTAATTYCAVARYDKSLSIHTLSMNDNNVAFGASSTMPSTKRPSLVYQTPKRVSCLTYAQLPANNAENNSNDSKEEFVQVLVTGDLAGDSFAYSLLTNKGHSSRLLLGHTASMLTGVTMLNLSLNSNDNNQDPCHQHQQYYGMATSDRDEKIRISRFPSSYEIEGYLLGHTKYISAIDASISSSKNNRSSLLVSCGGDQTVRLWDVSTMQELYVESTAKLSAQWQQQQQVPSDIAITSSGQMVAVIFDRSKLIQFYSVIVRDAGSYELKACHSVECPTQPLVISFDSINSRLLILLQEPECLMAIQIDEEKKNDNNATAFQTIRNDAFMTAVRDLVAKESIALPDTILEKDNQGNPVLEKEVESRGASAEEVPWKRPERIAVAKEKQRNRRRNKRGRKRQKRAVQAEKKAGTSSS